MIDDGSTSSSYSATKGSVGKVQTNVVQVLENGLILQSGIKLAGPIDVAYETYGTLTSERDNAVLLCHALSGGAHAAGWHEGDRKPGWWDDMIGPGKAFDTDQYFFICSNVIGSCYGSTGPESVNPMTGQRYGGDFPVVTIADMVHVQAALIEKLGIKKLLAVAGGSMGGMQVLQWAVSYPERMSALICIASTYRHSPQQIAFNYVAREAIEADPNWRNGHYYSDGFTPDHGLAVARMVGHITYLSEIAMERKFARALGRFGQNSAGKLAYRMEDDFSVETYLDYQGGSFVERFDANAMWFLTKALDYFDLSGEYGGWMRQALIGDTVEHATLVEQSMPEIEHLHFLLMSFNSDWLYPPAHLQRVARALRAYGCDVSYFNLDCDGGHDSFLLPEGMALQTRLIRPFLESHLKRIRMKQ